MQVEDRLQRLTEPDGQFAGVGDLLLAEADRAVVVVEGLLLLALDQLPQRVVEAGDRAQDVQGTSDRFAAQVDLGVDRHPGTVRVGRVGGLAVPADAVVVELFGLLVDQHAADDLADGETHGLERFRGVDDLHQNGEARLRLAAVGVGHDLSLHVFLSNDIPCRVSCILYYKCAY